MFKRKTQLPANWRKRIMITETLTKWGDMEFVLEFIKGRTPRGFMRHIGCLTVQDKFPHYCDVEIDNYFVKRGLGTFLYLHALNHFGSLSTSYHRSSDAAKGLWKSLIRKHKYEVDFFAPRLTIYKEKRK